MWILTYGFDELEERRGRIVSVKGFVSRVLDEGEFEIAERPLVQDPFQESVEIRSESETGLEPVDYVECLGIYHCEEGVDWIEARKVERKSTSS